MKNWKPYHLGKILNRVERFENKDDFKTYTFSGTYSYARGIFSSYSKSGTEFNLSKIQRIKKDDFIFCKIMAWEGAFGIAPEECDNTVMSGAFVAYEINKEFVEPKFIEYFFKIEKNWRNIGSGSSGTNVRRKTLFPRDFEKYEILLPTLNEQQRIIDKIESVKSSLFQISQLRAEQEKDISNFRYSVFEKLFIEYDSCEIGKLIEEKLDPVIVDPTEEYLFAGVFGFGKGLFIRGIQNGNDTTYKTFNRLHTNQIVMSQPKGWEGAITLIPKEFDGLFLSPVYSTFDVIENNNIGYVAEFCKLPTTWQKMLDVSKGIGARRNSIYAKDFLKIEIPNIPIEEQDRIVELLQGINEMKVTHKEQETELKQFMPSLLDKAFIGEL